MSDRTLCLKVEEKPPARWEASFFSRSTCGMTFFQLKAFPAAHGFFSRKGGTSAPPYSALNTAFKTADPQAAINRALLFKTLGLSEDQVMILNPNHGNRIAFEDGCTKERVLKETDAAFTRVKNRFFLISSADCIILIATDKELSFVGVIHLSWRNLFAGFGKYAVETLLHQYGICPCSLVLGISPCIYPCCYEVKNPVQKNDPSWLPFLRLCGDDIYAVDLVSALKHQLYKTGIQDKNIHEMNLCTGCWNNLFFSCFYEGYVSGRFPTLVGLSKI